MAFENLKVVFHWSEADFYDEDGIRLDDDKDITFTGEKAYAFLSDFVLKDKQLWNDSIFYKNGYFKSKISVSYDDYFLDHHRIDLGDLSFGASHYLADALSFYVRFFSHAEDNDEEFTRYMSSVEKLRQEETVYLSNHPDLQKKWDETPLSYLYAVSKQDLALISDKIKLLYDEVKPDDVQLGDNFRTCPGKEASRFLSYYLNHDPVALPSEVIFLRGFRQPEYLMENYNETLLTLIVPEHEWNNISDFSHDLNLTITHDEPLCHSWSETFSGREACSQLNDMLQMDENAYFSATGSHNLKAPFIPSVKTRTELSFKGEKFFDKTFYIGTMEFGLAVSKAFSEYLNSHPEMKDQLDSSLKYYSQDYGFQNLAHGYHDVSCFKDELPNKDVSLQLLESNRPNRVDPLNCSYSAKTYIDYLLRKAVLKAPNREEIPKTFALELASEGFGLRDSKKILVNSDLQHYDNVLTILKDDPDVKKSLRYFKKNYKPESTR